MREALIPIMATDKTKAAVRSVKGNLNGLKSTALKVGAALGVAFTVTGIKSFLEENRNLNDNLAKMSDKTGMAIERLQAYRQVAIEAGGSARGMDEALTKMNKRLAEAAELGGGAAAKWLEKLNLDVQELQTLSPDQVFARYSTAINGLSTRGEKLAAISALMGDESRSLINVIEGGVGPVNAMQTEMQALGVSINRVDAAKIEAANDALDRTKFVGQALGTSINVALAPVLQGLSNEFLNVAKEAGGMGEIGNIVVSKLVKWVGYAANAVQGLKLAWTAVKHAALVTLSKTIELLAATDRGLTKFINKFTPWTKEINHDLTLLAGNMMLAVQESRAELDAKINQPLSSNEIEKWYSNVKAKSEKMAVEAAEFKAEVLTINPEQVAQENSGMSRFLEKNKVVAKDYEQVWQGAFNNFSKGAGDALADVVLQQKKGSEALRGVAQSMARSVISSLGEIMAKRIAMWALEKTSLASSTAAQVGAAATQTAAWTPAAVASSIASFGANIPLALAGLASAFAVAKGLSGVAHNGLSYVPTDGTYLLQRGEKVVSNQDSRKLDRLMENGGQTFNITLQLSAIDTSNAHQFLNANAPTLINIVQRAYSEQARRGPIY